MTYFDIEAFLMIIQCGSITRAAKILMMTQSSLSRRMKLLEEELGYPLFVRKKGMREIRLTEQGTAFLPIAEKWNHLWKQAKEIQMRPRKQMLRISATVSVNYPLTAAYDAFSSRYRDTYLEIFTANSRDAYTYIKEEMVDLALISTPDDSEFVEARALFAEPCVFVCGAHADYPDEVHPNDLDVGELIWTNYDEHVKRWYWKWFGSRGLPYMTLHNAASYQEVLTQGRHWALMPASVFETSIKGGAALSTRMLKEGPPSRECHFLLGNGQPTELTKRFLFFICEYLKANFPAVNLLLSF